MFVFETITQITISIPKLGTFLWTVAQSTSNKCPSLVYMSVGMQMTDETILTACCHWSYNAWCYTLTTQQKCILLKCCILRSLQMHTLKKKLSRTSYNNHSICFLSFTSMVISISIDYGYINATFPCRWTWNAFLSILVLIWVKKATYIAEKWEMGTYFLEHHVDDVIKTRGATIMFNLKWSVC